MNIVKPADKPADKPVSNPQIEDFLKPGDHKRVAVFEVNEGSVIDGVSISDIRSTQLPEEVLVVSILRGVEAIIPSGDSIINTNDRVALMIRDSDLDKVERVFES